MLLSEYLSRHSLTYAEFGRRVGTKHARTVERYAKGQQRPNKTIMQRIAAATAGQVTANDFFGIELATEERRVA